MAAIQGLDSRVSRPRMTLGFVGDFAEGVGEGKAYGEDGGGVEGGIAGDGADAVGAEEIAGGLRSWSVKDNAVGAGAAGAAGLAELAGFASQRELRGGELL